MRKLTTNFPIYSKHEDQKTVHMYMNINPIQKGNSFGK